MDWQPIETFDYDAESIRQHTIFPGAWVTDGKLVVYAEYWGNRDGPDDCFGWQYVVDAGDCGPFLLETIITPILWQPKPDPPRV